MKAKGIEILLQSKKNEAYYKLIANIKEGTKEETKEIIEKLNSYINNDLEIVEREIVTVEL